VIRPTVTRLTRRFALPKAAVRTPAVGHAVVGEGEAPAEPMRTAGECVSLWVSRNKQANIRPDIIEMLNVNKLCQGVVAATNGAFVLHDAGESQEVIKVCDVTVRKLLICSHQPAAKSQNGLYLPGVRQYKSKP
jgi:hypothetical protein